jgi:hypothetical protein
MSLNHFYILFILLFVTEVASAQTQPRLGFRQKEGYYITVDGDTIDALVRKANLCDMAMTVKISLDDGTGVFVEQEFNPNLIKGFGFENFHFVSAGYNSTVDKLYIPSHPLNNYPKVFVRVYYNEGYVLISYPVYYRRSMYHPLGQDSFSGCSEFGYLKGRDNIFHLVKNVKEDVELLAKNDPVVMELTRARMSLNLEEAAEFLYRLDQHKKGIYFEDELTLYEKHKAEINKIKSKDNVADLVLSELKPLNTPDGVIICRRTAHENTQTLMRFGQETYAHFKTVERYLQKGMKLYQSDSLTHEFKEYIPFIKKGIEYLKVNLTDLDISYYLNELSYYEVYLQERKD